MMINDDDDCRPQKKMRRCTTRNQDVGFHEDHTPANSFPGENQRRLERSTRASCRLFGVVGMVIGCVGFGDRRCHVAGMGEVARLSCGRATNVLAFVTPPESDCEDSLDIDAAIVRGERGKENLMELKRPPLFSFSSLDLFGDAGTDADEVDEDDESAKWAKVGAGGRSGGVTGASEDSIQKCVSGEMTISSMSKSSSSVALSVAIDRWIEDSSSPSSSS